MRPGCWCGGHCPINAKVASIRRPASPGPTASTPDLPGARFQSSFERSSASDPRLPPLSWFRPGQSVCRSLMEMAVMITDRMSAPIRVEPFPTVKPADDDRGSDNPGCSAPIDIFAVANPDVFISVPDIVIGSVGHVARGCRRRGDDRWRLSGNWGRRRRVTPGHHQRQYCGTTKQNSRFHASVSPGEKPQTRVVGCGKAKVWNLTYHALWRQGGVGSGDNTYWHGHRAEK